MFKKQAKQIHEILGQYLRRSGLETPLLQHRVIDAWDEVVGNVWQDTPPKSIFTIKHCMLRL